MTIIHHYHPETGEYLGSGEAETSPLDGAPLVPRFATTITPPLAREGSALVFAGEGWTQIPDLRGTAVWNTASKQRSELRSLGPVPEGWTIHEPGALQSFDAGGGVWIDDPVLVAEARLEEILAELAALDRFIPRGLEDTWESLGFDTAMLPRVQQERLVRKQELRAEYAALFAAPEASAGAGV